ncbi:protein kinase domain-containing protein [Leptothermofonsia sp. ETS-13]|uniref:protein kinase domain-containing protein n=1 Tax=Leptothermofonsia sp. ETS-13 TaxID=3035696 RepID=UPI003BA28251
MRLLTGKLLARRYRIIRTLARGGFGQTYIAEDTQRPGNPKCLVKQLRSERSDSGSLGEVKRLFQTEAEVLEALGRHDQIPQLLAFFDENREFFLIQELIEGTPLSAELKLRKPWSEAEVCRLLYEVLMILVFIHGYRDRGHEGIIHRDIKPDNIIRRNRDRKPVLVDFGSVKQIRAQSAQEQSGMTINIGTPGYMPAEQARGSPRLNSDIYALGIIGIQASTGLVPNQLQEDRETGELVWRSHAAISNELAAILTQMTRYSFRDRYQSAQEVIRDLEPLLQKYGIPVSPIESLSTTASIVEETSAKSEIPPETIPPPQPTLASPSPSAIIARPATAKSEQQEESQSTLIAPLMPGRSQPSIPSEPSPSPFPLSNRRVWWGGAIGAVTLLAVLTISALQRQPSPPPTPSPDPLSQDQEIFNQAVQMAKKGGASLETAIQTARTIPPDSPLYSQAQKQIFDWQAIVLQKFLQTEVPKQSQELADVIATIKPKVERIDAQQIAISYDGSSNVRLVSEEGLRILTAAVMQRLRGNQNEKILPKYKNFHQLIVFPQNEKRQAILAASDWDSFVSSGAKERFKIYQKVQIKGR